MGFVLGVNLLPSTGEWTYDVALYRGKRLEETDFEPLNAYFAPGGTKADLDYSIDQLQTEFPECKTIALVISWFGSSIDAANCKIYPSTTYIGGAFERYADGAWTSDAWRCSGLTQASFGVIPITSDGPSFSYGGTPSDQSIVRCIRTLKARGLRVVFYPFILMDAPEFPWRGRIAFSPDISAAAAAAADAFLGSAVIGQFTRDPTNLTVAYSGPPTDYTFRRMILHYANLCVIAGGVDLFLLGSELRGLETIRGPGWTKQGSIGADGRVTWDYPFIDGLIRLADDVRAIFDAEALTKDIEEMRNLISYAADWSVWMGYQHPDSNGQWPHLDQLYAHANIDLVCFDNYLPLSDWTTGDEGFDIVNWREPAPASWPPSRDDMNGLGLTGSPTIYSKPYLKANIEGGEKYHWFYYDSDNLGRGLDPSGSDTQTSRPKGDRLFQSRNPYFANQQLLANKQIRWWWNNEHKAIYDDGLGDGFASHGPFTRWRPQSKSITFTEYGFPTCDRATNQPNAFFDVKSVESATPFWSIWDPADGARFRPRADERLTFLALQAVYEYWVEDGKNETSLTGVKMIEPTFMSVWNWDARPFPVFPLRGDVWGDAGNWRSGNWLSGKAAYVDTCLLEEPPAPAARPTFPTLQGRSSRTCFRPTFATADAEHVSGRESRSSRMSRALWEIEISFDVLLADGLNADLQMLAGFYAQMHGQDLSFTFPIPPELGLGAYLLCRFADDQEDLEEFMKRLFTLRTLKLRTVKE
jgi:hypothetical protein